MSKVKKFLIYNIFIFLICIVLKFFNYENIVLNYIEFNTKTINFQDFLSIGITVLSIFVGAIITVATVLISMCDRRVLKLIKKYKKSNYLVQSIKYSISTGLLAICLLAIIYARLDLNILILRLILLYISGFSLFIFISRSRILILLVLKLLNDSFNDDVDSIVIKAEVKVDNNEKKNV